MGSPRAGTTGTDQLRKYAKWLRERVKDLEAMRRRLEEGGMTTKDWGVLGGGIGSVGPNSAEPAYYYPVSHQAGPKLKEFKASWDAAHQAAIQRMQDLETVYDEAASGLWYVARDYDESHAAQKDAVNRVGEDTHGR